MLRPCVVLSTSAISSTARRAARATARRARACPSPRDAAGSAPHTSSHARRTPTASIRGARIDAHAALPRPPSAVALVIGVVRAPPHHHGYRGGHSRDAGTAELRHLDPQHRPVPTGRLRRSAHVRKLRSMKRRLPDGGDLRARPRSRRGNCRVDDRHPGRAPGLPLRRPHPAAHWRNGTTATRVLVTYVRYPRSGHGPTRSSSSATGSLQRPALYARLLDAWARAGYVVAAPALSGRECQRAGRAGRARPRQPARRRELRDLASSSLRTPGRRASCAV